MKERVPLESFVCLFVEESFPRNDCYCWNFLCFAVNIFVCWLFNTCKFVQGWNLRKDDINYNSQSEIAVQLNEVTNKHHLTSQQNSQKFVLIIFTIVPVSDSFCCHWWSLFSWWIWIIFKNQQFPSLLHQQVQYH